MKLFTIFEGLKHDFTARENDAPKTVSSKFAAEGKYLLQLL